MKIDDATLLEAIEIRKRFLKIYRKGVISIDSSFGIHLREEYFLDTFSEYEITDHDDAFTEKLTATFNGAQFFCIR